MPTDRNSPFKTTTLKSANEGVHPASPLDAPLPGQTPAANSVPMVETLSLRLLATSDLHAHILPWDHHTDRPAEARGLARVASLIDTARSEAPQNLLLDNGDFLHGSALGDHWATLVPSRRRAHPMVAAMNRLGYDAATLGNHEFSHGIGFLRACLEGASFPVVSANAHRKRGGLVPPWVLLTRQLQDNAGRNHVLTIGVIGFLPPLTTVWERNSLRGALTVEDILCAARREVPRLRAAGADLVIALSHSGIEADSGGPGHGSPGHGGERVSRALAETVGIDAVIAGHTHDIFPKPEGARTLAGKPVVMPGFFGSHLGVIDLDLLLTDGGWRVVGHRSELRAVGASAGQSPAVVSARADLVALTAGDHAALQQRNAEVIGYTDRPLSTHFALVTPSEAMAVIANAKADRLRSLLAGNPHGNLPILAAVAPFKCGGRGGAENYTHIPAGPLTVRHAADLYLHHNTLTGLRLTGAEVALWLERSVSLYHQIRPGAQDAPLSDPEFPSFNFDMIHGLSYRIDLSQPPRFNAAGVEINPTARRVLDIRFASGVPLDPKDRVILASHSYRSNGAAGFAGTGIGARVVWAGRDQVRDLVNAHIRSGATNRLRADWSFEPMPGTSVSLLDAPTDTPPPGVTQQGPDVGTKGFMRFRLTL